MTYTKHRKFVPARIALSITTFAAFGLFHATPAFAQTSPAPENTTGIRVSNAIIEAPLDAGQGTNKPIAVTNTSATALDVNTSISSLSSSVAKLPPEYQTTFDASSWISIEPAKFTLAPGAIQSVTAKINVPKSAESGAHYATITFATSRASQSSPDQSQLDIRGSVNAQAIITVGGAINTELRGIGNIGVTKINIKSPVTFDLNIMNSGNVHVIPQRIAIVVFERGSDKPSVRLEVPANVAQRIILPRTSQTYRLRWNELPGPGWLNAQAIVEYSEAGGKSRTLNFTSGRFYSMPMAIIVVVGIIGGVALLTAGNIWWRRRHRKKPPRIHINDSKVLSLTESAVSPTDALTRSGKNPRDDQYQDQD